MFARMETVNFDRIETAPTSRFCYAKLNLICEREEAACENGMHDTGAHPRGASGLQPPPYQHLKNTYFVNMMIQNVLRDLPFSRNQPLK
jgi:hypothetical protein